MLGIVTGLIGVGQQAWNLYDSYQDSNTKSYTQCPNYNPGAFSLLLARMSPADFDRMSAELKAIPIVGDDWPMTAEGLAGGWTGGDDCRHTSAEGLKWVETVQKYLTRYGVSVSQAVVDKPSAWDQIKDAGGEIIGNIGDVVKETAGATVKGGLPGGVVTSQAAATGAQTGTFAFNQQTLLLILAGLALALVFLRK